jgi:hypothetical protein
VEKKLGWLKSIGSLSAILPPPPVTATVTTASAARTLPGHKSRDGVEKKDSEETTDIQLVQHLPNDMVLRKSVTIEANFDLRECIQALRKRQRMPSTIPARNDLWKFEVSSTLDTNQDSRDSNYGMNKKSLQGDMLWLKQHPNSRNTRGIGEEEAGDRARGQVMCWQEALESLSAQYFQHVTPVFYIVGNRSSSSTSSTTSSAFRAMFYQKSLSCDGGSTPSTDKSEQTVTYECIIHRCTNGIFEDLKALGVPLHVLGAAGTVGDSSSSASTNSGVPPSYKEREKLNLFSENMRRSKNNTTDRVIHLAGNTDMMVIYHHLLCAL